MMFFTRTASAAAVMGSLEEIEVKLRVLGRSTEDEFLAIGEGLRIFHHRAGEISETAASVGSLLSGEVVGGAMEELRFIFERMDRVKGESGRNIQKLEKILEALLRLKSHLEGFTKVIRMLNALCNCTRIENARLCGQDVGFDALADDVSKLASMIESKSGELLEKSESMGAVIRDTLSHLSGLRSLQTSHAKLVQDNTLESLDSLTERHRMAAIGAENISRMYGSISGSMGEIVTSLQFHDITRQRIEHVAQAINSVRVDRTRANDRESVAANTNGRNGCNGRNDLNEHHEWNGENGREGANGLHGRARSFSENVSSASFGRGPEAGEPHDSWIPAFAGMTKNRIRRIFGQPPGGTAGNGQNGLIGWLKLFGRRQKPPAFTGDVCGLQAAQLEQAGDELVSAVSRISRSLSEIAASILEISAEVQGMAGVDGKADKSFFTEIEAGVLSAASALSDYGNAGDEMHSAMGAVGSMLGDMSTFAGDIEGIGTKIKLIALNAIVKASHMGEEGAALNVLAENIHHLSAETGLLTDSVCDTLRSIIAASDELAATAAVDDDPRGGEIRKTGEAIRELSAVLSEVSRDAASLLDRMDREGRALAADIRRAVSAIDVHEKVEAGLGEILGGLREVIAASEVSKEDRQSSEMSHYVKSIETSYTMEGEREIHNALLNAESTSKVSPSAGDGSLWELPPPGGLNGESSSEKSSEDEDLGDNVELF